MRLADFLLLHAETVEISLAGQDGPWYPVTAATLAGLPAAYLAREVLVDVTGGGPAGHLWVADRRYAWRLARPGSTPIGLASLSARWRAWLEDTRPVARCATAPHLDRTPRRTVLGQAATGLVHVLVGG